MEGIPKFAAEVISLAVLFTLEGFFPLFLDRHRRGRHALRNMGMGILNGFTIYILFSSLTWASLRWTKTHSWGLLNFLGLPPLAAGLAAFVLFDLWMYLWHNANHRVPFLWHFHRAHHTDRELDSTSALRFHLGEIVLSSCARLFVIPVLGMEYVHLFAYEICLQPVILFHHSNVALPERWDKIFRLVLVTPNMHRVHHSQEVEETNSNYSSIFSFWDRIARTFRIREDARTLRYGLPEFLGPEWQVFWGMLKTPFASAEAGRQGNE